MRLWLLGPIGIAFFILGLASGNLYPAVNTLWLLLFLGTLLLIILWVRHINEKIDNLLVQKPNPKLINSPFPVYVSELARTESKIANMHRKLEVAELNLLSQKALQVGEGFGLLFKAATDNLTGLPNREQLDIHVARVFKKVIPLSVIIADLDYFKKINDTYGHDAGDEVLRRFARIVKKSIRQEDYVFRYGGEEFIVVANADLEKAVEISNRVREEVARATISWNKQTISITASFGAAEYKSGDTPESLVKRADEALYRAKNNGRNRVEGEVFN
ncbi:MAG: GGDEF domain-containing protein [Bacillota bacterium]